MSLGTDYIIRYLSDISGAVKGAKQLEAANSVVAKNIQEQYGKAVEIIGEIPSIVKSSQIPSGRFAGLQKDIITTGEVVKTTKGNFLELGKTETFIAGQLVSTTTAFKDQTSAFVKGNLEAAKGNKVFTNFADNVKQLAGRALLTIPIWIALRSALTGLFTGIQGGIKNLIDFDLSLQKIRNNLQGTPEEVSAAFKKIRSSITEASKASGISTEELAGAVKEFATLGFSANESLQGALGASKLSIALFGDAGETAGAFARALNIMIDRSVGAKSAIDQMNEAFALTSQLEETNNFEIKNVTEALDKFAGTAAGVGLTMNQTLAILAALGTAGRQGSEGATLLSTSFNQLLSNIPKISKSLGIVVGTGESTFETFRKIIDEITRLNSIPGGQNASIQAIGDIFGGARGIKIVQSLIAVKDILDKNISTLPSFTALNQKAERTLNSESGQAKILGNSLKEMGKSFITAAAGSEDFTGAIVTLNNAVKGISEGLKPLGSTLHAIFDNLGFIAGAAFLLKWRKIVTTEAILSHLLASRAAFAAFGARLAFIFGGGLITGFKTLGKLAVGSLVVGIEGASAAGIVGAAVAALFSPIVIITGVLGKIAADALTENFIRGVQAKNDKAQAAFQKFVDGLKGNLSISDLTALISELTLELKPGDLVKAREIGALRKRLQEQINKSTIVATPNIDVQPVVSFEEQQSIAKALLASKLDELKAQGASNSELLKAKILGTDQLKIQEDTLSLLNNQLDLQKAIKEEKRLQNKLGSDSIKLFEIAKTEGTEVAKRIGDVLSGDTSFTSFVRRGGKELEVFKKEFADVFKQQQAVQFFTGERVSESPELRGGTRIAIQEESIRKAALPNLQQEQAKLVAEFTNINTALHSNDTAVNRNTEAVTKLTNSIVSPALRGIDREQALISQEKQFRVENNIVPNAKLITPTTLPFEMRKHEVNINGVKVEINAQNAEDLQNQIDIKFDEMKSKVKTEINKQLPQSGTETNKALIQALSGKQGNNI
jgi:TP901 family phage tail tape measure protein